MGPFAIDEGLVRAGESLTTVRIHNTNTGKIIVAVDGKTSKGSKDKSKDQKALHMVSALCQSHGLVIGQTKTDEKSNEIPAIPALLDQLFIEGCIVTINAMGLQKKIVKKIVNENKADYVINLKGNQETLQQEVKGYFEELKQTGALKNIKKQAQKENANKPKESGASRFTVPLKKGMGASKSEPITMQQISIGWWMPNANGKSSQASEWSSEK